MHAFVYDFETLSSECEGWVAEMERGLRRYMSFRGGESGTTDTKTLYRKHTSYAMCLFLIISPRIGKTLMIWCFGALLYID